MKIEQIYTGCIAHAAYYIESKGEAAIFDPLRDVDPYIERANKDNAVIKYVFETHFHADFVSGHLDLKEKTGAKIVFGPTATPSYEAVIAEDNQIFTLGDIQIKVLHTPGHTMESSTYLIIDENGKEHAIISGDTLFIGDVGRPDLVQLVKSEITEEILARHLFQSLRNKIMVLPDDIIVYPNHGAGSACGKNMSKETVDTLGNQKKTNYALRADMTEDEFVVELLTGLATPPQYFPKNVLMNITGYEELDSILDRSMNALTVEEVKELIEKENVIVLDTRNPQLFSEGFMVGSLNIGLNGQFAVWVGELIKDIKAPIVIIAEQDKVEESMIRLSRVGYDNYIGYLQGGFEAWKAAGEPVQTVTRITPAEMDQMYLDTKGVLLDVRKINEFKSEHLEDSISLPLNQLEDKIDLLSKDKRYIIYCAGGYRSMMAASIMYKHGYTNLVDVLGGYNAISKDSSLDHTDFVCPTSML
ncbi:MBL fold metallo-hydrolase [Myroides marinus]|uniref:MBL fold metallo-hydrolase n=1 Tax=Myroides marinus TaxID=703342 RepID=UPI002574EED0|nr:MBL fold metallo-hydrolase [Myroides marinus]MDM1347103.1 MBL fold metallo-hydrolase [Myroides marinus]MDM1350622.1 MBL fold metallo-hydrolase [Myroides marinus]MDM1354342.1 MBL fold metallo-hydrolase [Myroides marinus]MDM1357829.1 MBL fold metallo-hydrolase [Myroides marinus]MDM1365237.1 MBL fold metallo-hydrolase [Myroides marinus]